MTDRDVIDAKVDLIDVRLTLLEEDLDDVRVFIREIYAHMDADK